MSISGIGSSVSRDSSFEAYLLRQERIALFQQQASTLEILRSPVTSSAQISGANNLSANTNTASRTNANTANKASTTNNQASSSVSSTANLNAALSTTANSNTSLSFSSLNPNNGLNGSQFSLLAAQFDINAQISAT